MVEKKVWSAGGVVVRGSNGSKKEVVLCNRKAKNLWALPKGTPNTSEDRESTALREVTEETGLDVECVSFLGETKYRFGRGVIKYDKTVYFYLMRCVGGFFSRHDDEFDFVGWFELEKALEMLTYESEREIVRQAVSKSK